MSPSTALLFPGQGSQTPEMRDVSPSMRPDLLELAAEAVGEDPFPRVDEGTNYAQPAIFCASLAGWSALGRPPTSSWPATRSASSARWSPPARLGSARASSSWRCADG